LTGASSSSSSPTGQMGTLKCKSGTVPTETTSTSEAASGVTEAVDVGTASGTPIVIDSGPPGLEELLSLPTAGRRRPRVSNGLTDRPACRRAADEIDSGSQDMQIDRTPAQTDALEFGDGFESLARNYAGTKHHQEAETPVGEPYVAPGTNASAGAVSAHDGRDASQQPTPMPTPSIPVAQVPFFEDLLERMSANVSIATCTMHDSMKELVTALDRRLGQVEDNHNAQVAQAHTALALHDVTFEQRSRDIEMLQRSVASLNTAPRPVDARTTVQPWSMRTKATMGRLGWNTPVATVLERAQTLLTDAGVDEAAFAGLKCASADTGSQAELHFAEPEALRMVQDLVLKLARNYQAGNPNGDRPAWLGVYKTREELKPNRVLGSMFDYIMEVEAMRGAGGAPLEDIEKCGRTKTVSIKGVGRLGMVNRHGGTALGSGSQETLRPSCS
jgi:hypothetical protein